MGHINRSENFTCGQRLSAKDFSHNEQRSIESMRRYCFALATHIDASALQSDCMLWRSNERNLGCQQIMIGHVLMCHQKFLKIELPKGNPMSSGLECHLPHRCLPILFMARCAVDVTRAEKHSCTLPLKTLYFLSLMVFQHITWPMWLMTTT